MHRGRKFSRDDNLGGVRGAAQVFELSRSEQMQQITITANDQVLQHRTIVSIYLDAEVPGSGIYEESVDKKAGACVSRVAPRDPVTEPLFEGRAIPLNISCSAPRVPLSPLSPNGSAAYIDMVHVYGRCTLTEGGPVVIQVRPVLNTEPVRFK